MTDQQINEAIAEACGWTQISSDGVVGKAPGETCNRVMFLPLYCTDLNAMHEAEKSLPIKKILIYFKKLEKGSSFWFRATARERAEAFLLTLGKWSATDKDSLTVGATAEESAAVQSTSSGGSGEASTYGGKGLGIAGGDLPPETQITVNGKTFCLADIDKEMPE